MYSPEFLECLQIAESVSNTTNTTMDSALPSGGARPKLRSHQTQKPQLSIQHQQLLHQQMQSHIDLVALTEKDKKRVDSKKLKKRLLEVSEINENMAKAISEKNTEIASLKTSVQSLNDVLNSVPIDEMRCNSSIASTKILELSKKNRQLRVELETTKNRLAKKDLQCQKLEREMKLTEERWKTTDNVRKGEKPTAMDEMQTKINQLQQRLFESRNKTTELHNQLKLAQKCLQQEVGEHFQLHQLANGSTNWRGRAQQILYLQQKINELKERLEFYENPHASADHVSYSNIVMLNNLNSDAITTTGAFMHHGHNSPKASITASASASASGEFTSEAASCVSNTTIIDRYASGVRKNEIIHRAKVEAFEKEISSLKQTVEDLRGKMLALKVRNKTLNDEMNKYKAKANSLEEQTDYNCVNLSEMTEKLNLQKYYYENRLNDLNNKYQEVMRERDLIELREKETESRLETVQNELQSHQQYISELKMVIKRLEDEMKNICGGFLFSCRELRREEFIAILDALETEKNGLLEQNKVLTARLDHERYRNESLADTLAKQKIRISRAETRIRDLEKELEVFVERKKRSQRITDYANSLNTIAGGSVTSFVFENSSAIALGRTDSNLGEKEAAVKKTAELLNQLELSTEKINLLEEKIAYLTKEKERDAKSFEKIVSDTKEMLLETILGQSRGLGPNITPAASAENLNIHINVMDS